MAAELKRFIIGRALRTEQAAHERLSKKTALPFSLPMRSLLRLMPLRKSCSSWPLRLPTARQARLMRRANFHRHWVLLVIVASSYRQTIHAYPSGGGAYIVAKENLGTNAGLVAGASLLVDYVLTVAVSIAAGVAAITSMVQGTRYAWLDHHKVVLCLIFITFIAIADLRGVRESGSLFAAPTYAFLISFFFMIGYGLFSYYTYGGAAPSPAPKIKSAKDTSFSL